MLNTKNIAVLGVGKALAENVVTNKDLEKTVDTSDEWITTRTGIRERRVCSEETAASILRLLPQSRLWNGAARLPKT